MSIIIGADFVPTESNSELFIEGNIKELLGEELVYVLNEADYRIFNLEVPLTNNSSPIFKCGPNLIASTKTIKAYVCAGTNLVTLANNHILDQGEKGLIDTVHTLEENHIAYVGIGRTQRESSKPHYFTFQGKKIGVYVCAEHEFSITPDGQMGANPFDPLETPEHIEKIKGTCDYLIVLYHGGKEHYRYPSPLLQRICHKIIDKGADLIICQHSHCIGSKEEYLNGTIVYGQGNFVFDHQNNEYWKTSILVKIADDFSIEYIPLVKFGNGVRIAKDFEKNNILEEFNKRSEKIYDLTFLQEEYDNFAKTMKTSYLLDLAGVKRNLGYKIINKLTHHKFGEYIVNKKYNRDRKIILRNYFECEAHRELIETIFRL